MIDFVGAGSGAADLITLRGKKLLEEEPEKDRKAVLQKRRFEV